MSLPPQLRAEFIKAVAAIRFEMMLTTLSGPSAKRHHVHARWAAMRLIYDMDKFSLNEIGAMLGGRHHTTVIHGCQAAHVLSLEDPTFRGHLRAIRAAMRKLDN